MDHFPACSVWFHLNTAPSKFEHRVALKTARFGNEDAVSSKIFVHGHHIRTNGRGTLV
jgi:hypothetical protein